MMTMTVMTIMTVVMVMTMMAMMMMITIRMMMMIMMARGLLPEFLRPCPGSNTSPTDACPWDVPCEQDDEARPHATNTHASQYVKPRQALPASL